MALSQKMIYICTMVLLACLSGLAAAEYSYSQNSTENIIRGTVLEKNSDEPLPLVHVYISYSSVGTTTDRDGNFEFSVNLRGPQQLVFSFIGFQTVTKELNLDSPNTEYTFSVEMEPSTEELGEIEVITSNTEWQQHLDQFNRQFVGTTEFSRETIIENPWVLDFEINSQRQIVASAVEPLHIVNNALGYRLRIDLEEYIWEANDETGYYTYHIKFEELTTENRRIADNWQRNRKRAYMGSFEHFLSSLYHDKLWANRFEVVFSGTNNQTTISEMGQFHVQQRLRQYGLGRSSYASGTNIKGYRLLQLVDILFGTTGNLRDNRQRGGIVAVTDRKEFFVTAEGRLLNPLSLRRDGYWRLHRIANVLPIDYTVD